MPIQIIHAQAAAVALREAGLLYRCYGGTKLEMLDDGWWRAEDIRETEWPVYDDDYITFAVLLEE